MKVSQNQLDDLLELAATDREISASRAQIANLREDPELALAQQQQAQASVVFLDASNVLEELQLELSRIEADVKLVEQREARDRALLESAKNPKDAQGLQAELATLAKRKNALEDTELEVMERLAEAEKAVAAAKANRDEMLLKIESLQLAQSQAVAKIQSGLTLLQGTRELLSARIPQDLLELFEQKAKRSVAVGRLSSRECGACRMSLTATDYSRVSSLPADELVTCPECQAILVRS